jgi:hypothetical protein
VPRTGGIVQCLALDDRSGIKLAKSICHTDNKCEALIWLTQKRSIVIV